MNLFVTLIHCINIVIRIHSHVNTFGRYLEHFAIRMFKCPILQSISNAYLQIFGVEQQFNFAIRKKEETVQGPTEPVHER